MEKSFPFLEKQQEWIRFKCELSIDTVKSEQYRQELSGIREFVQIDLGIELAQFVNEQAKKDDQGENIEYRLEECEKLGLFPKNIDDENYILIPKKFGPKKFVEAFTYKLIKIDSAILFKKTWAGEEMAGS